jgi:hypothetical protein
LSLRPRFLGNIPLQRLRYPCGTANPLFNNITGKFPAPWGA